MTTKVVQVSLQEGVDARPMAMLVQVASQYEASIYIEHKTKRVNAKSIMGMMTLALKNGDEVTVVTDGSDEDKAAEHIGNYLTGQIA